MFLRLLTLEWKAFFRSDNMGRGLGVKILLGFLAIYFGLVFLAMGVSLYFALEKYAPDTNPVMLVNQFLLVWFLAELALRFVLQSVPVTGIKPLLTQRIERRQIVHYLLSKSALSFFNLLAPLVFVPFTLVSIGKTDYSAIQLLGWLVAVLSVVLAINFLNLLIQKKFAENLKALIPAIVVCLAVYFLDYFGLFSASALFGKGFDLVLSYPYLCLIPVMLAIAAYLSSFRSFVRHLYLDAYMRDKASSYTGGDLSWTNRFGALAPFLQLDLRMIWRNKRPRSTVYVSLAFLFYGLLFYPNPVYADSSFLIFIGIFITSMFTINFGQFVPAWDSSYYPMMMSQNIPLGQYLQAKAMLMYVSIGILTLLSIPYVYFGWKILFINLACAVYNVGVNIPVLLYFGSYNRKRIDLDKSQFLNYQGTGAAQWIVSIPLLVAPILIWYLVSRFAGQSTATAILALLGIVGFLLKNALMTRIIRAYQKRKYTMIAGFKQQG